MRNTGKSIANPPLDARAAPRQELLCLTPLLTTDFSATIRKLLHSGKERLDEYRPQRSWLARG